MSHDLTDRHKCLCISNSVLYIRVDSMSSPAGHQVRKGSFQVAGMGYNLDTSASSLPEQTRLHVSAAISNHLIVFTKRISFTKSISLHAFAIHLDFDLLPVQTSARHRNTNAQLTRVAALAAARVPRCPPHTLWLRISTACGL